MAGTQWSKVMDRPRVVITGLGVIAPNGLGKEDFSAALCSGRSGVELITNFDASGLNSRIAGQVADFHPEEFLGRKDLKRMERFVQMAVVVSRMAAEDAGLDLAREDRERIGVLLGTGMGSLERTEKECRTLFAQGAARISPLYMATAIPNVAAAQVAITMGLQGYLGTTLASCAAGTQAVGEAFFLLQRGEAEIMIAGGTEANITPLAMGSFCSMKALSTRNEDPRSACRPFDRTRDGFVLAEGAAVLVLETLEHARKRDARLYGEVAGFGVSSDAYHLTAPDPSAGGMRRAMQRALLAAEVNAEEVDYINPHGTGTRLNDSLESFAIKEVFGARAYAIPVSSTKSMTGHSLAAAGAIELVATLLSMERGFIPPTINYEQPDSECDLDYVPNRGREGNIRVAMSNSFGFGGQNASIVVRRI